MKNRNKQDLEKLPPFVKYFKIPYSEEAKDIFGREVYVFEKIDGSLSQVRRTENAVLGGSRSNYITGSTKRPLWAPKFLKWMHSNHSLYNLPPGMIIFGEWLDPVTIDYETEFLDKFYFIDLAIVDENGNPNFYDYNEALGYIDKWGIKSIEILNPICKSFLDRNKIEDIVLNIPSYLRSSKINEDTGLVEVGEMEGVVLKNYHLQEFAKFLNPKYSEIRNQEKTLEARYITEMRTNKAKRRLRDSGNLDFNLDELVQEIIKDINEETGIAFEPAAVKGVLRIHNYNH